MLEIDEDAIRRIRAAVSEVGKLLLSAAEEAAEIMEAFINAVGDAFGAIRDIIPDLLEKLAEAEAKEKTKPPRKPVFSLGCRPCTSSRPVMQLHIRTGHRHS